MSEVKTKLEKLQESRAHRVEEIENYQINIDGFEDALSLLDAAPGSAREQFRAELENRLADEKREQEKAQMMLDVLSLQIARAQSS